MLLSVEHELYFFHLLPLFYVKVRICTANQLIMSCIDRVDLSVLIRMLLFCHYPLWYGFYFQILQGQNGSHFEPRPVPPPLPNKCDWEVDPSELDFSNSAIIGKVWILLKSFFCLSFCLCIVDVSMRCSQKFSPCYI